MKNILKLMALFAFLLCFISCDEDEKAEIPTLPVTAANLNGTWHDGHCRPRRRHAGPAYGRRYILLHNL